VFVAVGLSLSAARASDMAIKMSMASGMDMSHDGDCAGCPDPGPDGGKVSCPSVCVIPVVALVSKEPSAAIASSRLRTEPPPCHSLRGRQQPPDPYPPRSINLA
jgi:hypothetical protein